MVLLDLLFINDYFLLCYDYLYIQILYYLQKNPENPNFSLKVKRILIMWISKFFEVLKVGICELEVFKVELSKFEVPKVEISKSDVSKVALCHIPGDWYEDFLFFYMKHHSWLRNHCMYIEKHAAAHWKCFPVIL